MKASVSVLESCAGTGKSPVTVAMELVKARLTLMVIITTAVGFYLGAAGRPDFLLMLHTLIGTSALAAGAAVLNQWWERAADARMERTRERPIPSGRVRPEVALAVGLALAGVGLIYLRLLVSDLTAGLGLLTLVLYLLVYTPLKLVTPLNTLVGALPGALPPLMGWSASAGSVSAGGIALFGLLAFWQIPHFLAISWLYRDDYVRGGFRMLSRLDQTGRRTATHALAYTVGLVLISLAPFLLNLVGGLYVVGALLLGSLFLYRACLFRRRISLGTARGLFLVSILYLPLVLGCALLAKH